MKAVTTEAKRLKKDVFQEWNIDILHSKMKAKEKDAVMEKFAKKEIDILVATSVVEVGVNVPNATVILIEGAERFGLSQLHQLRGRVGRGQHHSYCFLISNTRNPVALERLKAMEQTQDGFKLAELDLQLRGSGDLIGTRQSGLPDLGVADLIRDLPLVEKAKSYVEKILENDLIHQAPQYQLLLKEIDRKKNREFLRAQLN
jgi:ATP-dependent DNA helicase RecG